MDATATAAVRTLEQAAVEYAESAHADIVTDARTYNAGPFTAVEDYLDYEFNGDASSEARDLAREFGVDRDEAETALRAALSDIQLGELNAFYREELVTDFLMDHAEAEAKRILEANYEDEDFEPEGHEIDPDEFEPEFRAGLAGYGFEATDEDRAACKRLLNEALAELVDDRDREVVQDYLNDFLCQEAGEPNEWMGAFARLRNRGIEITVTVDL